MFVKIPPGERQPGDAFLNDAMGTDLHEAVVASAFRHLCQHGIEADGVRRGVRGGKRLVVDSVDDRGDESRLVTEPAEQVVEQGGGLVLPLVPVTPTSFSLWLGSP